MVPRAHNLFGCVCMCRYEVQFYRAVECVYAQLPVVSQVIWSFCGITLLAFTMLHLRIVAIHHIGFFAAMFLILFRGTFMGFISFTLSLSLSFFFFLPHFLRLSSGIYTNRQRMPAQFLASFFVVHTAIFIADSAKKISYIPHFCTTDLFE